MLENTESQEMYLTTIYALQKKNGMVRSVDVADERGYKKSKKNCKFTDLLSIITSEENIIADTFPPRGRLYFSRNT